MLKQPFEIYVDELIREVRRRSKRSPEGVGHPRNLTRDQYDNAELVAAEATAYHLVDEMDFSPEDAQDVITAFRDRKSLNKEDLKHVWTDIALRRGRNR